MLASVVKKSFKPYTFLLKYRKNRAVNSESYLKSNSSRLGFQMVSVVGFELAL